MLAVRSDHHSGSLGDRRAALGVAADARHAALLDQDLLDGEGFAQFGAGRHGCVDQQRVEHDAPRAVSPPLRRPPAAEIPRW